MPRAALLFWTGAKILFSGDEAAKGVMLYWQQPEPQPTIEHHARNMEKLLTHRTEFDFVCSGHGEGLDAAELVDILLEHDHWIMDGHEGTQMERKNNGPGRAGPTGFHHVPK